MTFQALSSSLNVSAKPRQGRAFLRRFLDALQPLRDAGKLGVILFQFPQWFVPSRHAFARLEQIAAAVAPDRVAVEFRQHLWMDDAHEERTLAFLADHGLVYVAVDEPQGFTSSIPPVAAATTGDLAVVRFHGRNEETWNKKGVTAAERFAYDYSPEELREWTPKLEALIVQYGEQFQIHAAEAVLADFFPGSGIALERVCLGLLLGSHLLVEPAGDHLVGHRLRNTELGE